MNIIDCNKNFIEQVKKMFIFLFVFFCLIFPATDFIISKKILFSCNMGVLLLDSLNAPKRRITTWCLIYRFIIIFTIIVVFSIPTFAIHTEECTFLIISCTTLLIMFASYGNKVFLFKSIIITTNILAFITIFIGLLSLYSKVFVLAVNSLFLSLESGYLGTRDFGGLELIMVHFRTAPIMIISVSYYFIKTLHNIKINNIFFLTVQILAIVFSASRGTMLFSVISFLLLLCFDLKTKHSLRLLFCFVFIGVIGCTYLLTQTTMFSVKEKSNDIKIGHIESFNEYISEEPTVLLWGRGTGSFYYSKGFGKMTFQTEVTLLDMIRYFGLFFTFLFVFLVIFPSKKSIINIPFIMYFLDATTNPLIFCSTGMLVIALYYLLPNKSEIFNLKTLEKRGGRLRFKYVLLHCDSSL